MNSIGSIVKIVENPCRKISSENNITVEFRAEIPQIRNKAIVKLIFWGNLAGDVINYYKINDYIMIEGYLFSQSKDASNLIKKESKEVQIIVLKVYPFLLNVDHLNKKT